MKSIFYFFSVFSVIGKNLLKTLKLNDKILDEDYMTKG